MKINVIYGIFVNLQEENVDISDDAVNLDDDVDVTFGGESEMEDE